jgi:hypothetical protein
MADLVRHGIDTAGAGVDTPSEWLLDNVKDKTWSVIEGECRKSHDTGVELFERKDTVTNL